MRSLWREDHTIRLALIGVAVTLIYVTILLPLGFLETARSSSSDLVIRWRSRLQPPPQEIQQLLLITVDDESQRHLNQKWPWDRALFAEFLRQVGPHAPRGVLLDLAFVGKSGTPSDGLLAQAIREGPPTLVAAYLDPRGELMLPLPELTDAGGVPGLINKPLDRDHKIRRSWGIVHYPGHREPLFGIEIRAAALLLGIPQDQIGRETGALKLGPRRIPVGRVGELPINYLAPPEAFQTFSFWKALEGSVPPEAIRNKLVLVGTSREITHDIHPTPLGRLPGIVIEANGILTVLTGRFTKSLPMALLLAFSLILVLGLQQITYRNPVPVGLLAVAVFFALAAGSTLWLVRRDFSVELISPLILGASGWLTGFLYKHFVLVSEALRLQHQAVTDGLTGAFTGRYFRLRVQEEVMPGRSHRRPAALILVQEATSSQLLQDQPWEEVKRHLTRLVTVLKQDLPPRGIVGYLQEGRFGLFLPNTPSSQAEGYARKLQELLRSVPGLTALSLASTDKAPSARNGSELIRCAEAALKRAISKGGFALEICSSTDPGSAPSRPQESPENEKLSDLDYVASEMDERNRILEKSLTELRQAHQSLESAFLEVTKSLVMALETKDSYTAGHLERVSRYSARLAEVLNLPAEEVRAIREAALLHDIGKIGLPDEVLHKVGKLTPEETGIIREHLAIGAKILEPMKFFKSITTLIYHHHEWYNGQGYPHGLAGDFIPAGAQVIAIADSFDAMTTQRSYNKPKPTQEALEEIRRGAGTQFNPAYVEKFVEVISQEGPQLAGHATP